MTEPKSREIWRYELKNTLCQECMDNPDLQLADATPTNLTSKPLKQMVPSEFNNDMQRGDAISQLSDNNLNYPKNQEIGVIILKV